jgi:hypothetical protein
MSNAQINPSEHKAFKIRELDNDERNAIEASG